VVVLCTNCDLNFGRLAAVASFLRELVQWIDLDAAAAAVAPGAAGAARGKIPASSRANRAEVDGTVQQQELADVIAATMSIRFNGRSLSQLCTMGSITVDECKQSVAYREFFAQGRQEGKVKGRQDGRRDEAASVLSSKSTATAPPSQATPPP
jgi:hypothetical protein